MISSIFLDILLISLMCTGIMFLFLLIRRITKKCTYASWRIIIWMAILLRLCIPLVFETPIGLIQLKMESNGALSSILDEYTATSSKSDSSNTALYKTSDDNVIFDESYYITNMPEKYSWINILGMIYFAGLFAALILLSGKYITSRIYIKKLRKCDDMQISNLLNDLKNQMGVKGEITLLIDKTESVPVVFGIYNINIILPEADIEKSLPQLKIVLAHELMHCKHKDIMKLWILELSICINWFNPFMYIFKNIIIQDLEIACDEKVLSSKDFINAYEYSLVIAEYTVWQNKHRALLPSYGFAKEQESLLKTRLNHIKRFHKGKYRLVSIMLCAFILLIIISSTSLNTAINNDLPVSFDWRDKGIVLAPQDQGEYGAGSIFAAVSMLESHIALTSDELVDLSEQYFINTTDYWSSDTGVSPGLVLDFLVQEGTILEDQLPYTGVKEAAPNIECIYKLDSWGSYELSDKSPSERIEAIKKHIIEYGPVITPITFYYDLNNYDGGVYEYDKSSSADFGHWLTIIGWKDDYNIAGGGYWIVKESWGTDWGENGFARIAYNDPCGIDDFSIYYADKPII